MTHNAAFAEVSTIFSALAEAKEAMETLPKLKEENSQLYDMVGTLEEQKRAAETRIADLEAERNRIEADLREKLEALNAATFRENEVRTQLASFRSMVSGALSSVTDAVAETEKSVEAVVEVVTKPIAPQGDGGVMEPTKVSDPSAETPDAAPEPLGFGSYPPPFIRAPEVAPRPYEGRDGWRKPSDMTWGDWKRGGGSAPDWANDWNF